MGRIPSGSLPGLGCGLLARLLAGLLALLLARLLRRLLAWRAGLLAWLPWLVGL